MQYIQVKDISEIIQAFKDSKIPFLLESTTFTKKLITKDKIFHYIPVSDMLNCEAGLIRSVKMFADKIDAKLLPKVNRMKISYIRNGYYNVGLHENDEYFEIDLNKAFWEFSFREKTISEKIYLRGLNKDEFGNDIPPILNAKGEITNHNRKPSRLIAMGNLAKRKQFLQFNGNVFSRPKSEPARNESIFFNVAQLTDATMKRLELIAGRDFIFYWCDAIFFRGTKTRDNICEFLQDQMKFEFKVIPINKIDVRNDSIKVWDNIHLFTLQDFEENNCKKNEIGKPKPRPFLFRSLDTIDLSNLVEFKKEKYNLKFLKQ